MGSSERMKNDDYKEFDRANTLAIVFLGVTMAAVVLFQVLEAIHG